MAAIVCAEGVGLIGLHVDEEEGRGLAPPLEVELAREPPLEERDGGEERDTDAERHGHADRLAPRPGQGVEAVTPRERARPREPSGKPPRGPRGEGEKQQRARRRAQEDAADPQRARLPERERGQAGGHDAGGRPRPAGPHAARVDRVAQQDRRRNRAGREERPEREEERRQAPGQEPGRHRHGRDSRLELEGDERLRSGPSRSWAAVPRADPARLPRAPSASAWTR